MEYILKVSSSIMIMNYDPKENSLKNHIEQWLIEENISYNTINEPNHLFHFVLQNKDFNIPIEIFQEKNTSDLIVGIMIFLSNELNYNVYRFTQSEKEDFKIKVDEFLSTIRLDYRTGLRVGYDILNEKGHYGAKYFIKTKMDGCEKEKLLKILKLVKNTCMRSEEFLNKTLKK